MSDSDGSDGQAALSADTLALLRSLGFAPAPIPGRAHLPNGDPARDAAAVQPLHASSPAAACGVLAADGVVRLDSVLSAGRCADCVLALDAALAAAVAAGRDRHAPGRESGFGNVDAPSHRWDIYMDGFEENYWKSFEEMLGGGTPLCALFGDVFRGRDAAFHELAGLISDPGAESQRVHPDTVFQENGCPLYTCFVALQDTEAAMGPTHFVRGSHCAAAHASLRHSRDDYLASCTYSHALLRKGDAVVYGAWSGGAAWRDADSRRLSRHPLWGCQREPAARDAVLHAAVAGF